MTNPLIGKVVVNDLNMLRDAISAHYSVGQIRHNGDHVFRVELQDGWILNVFTTPIDDGERHIRILGICDAQQ